MFNWILDRLFGDHASNKMFNDLEVSVAALLVLTAGMDDHLDQTERDTIGRLLSKRFDLSNEASRMLIEAAERSVEHSNQIFPFVQCAVGQLSPDQRIELIEMLWELAYADGVLTPDEDALIRRIAGLIYVSDYDRGAARWRTRRLLGFSD